MLSMVSELRHTVKLLSIVLLLGIISCSIGPAISIAGYVPAIRQNADPMRPALSIEADIRWVEAKVSGLSDGFQSELGTLCDSEIKLSSQGMSDAEVNKTRTVLSSISARLDGADGQMGMLGKMIGSLERDIQSRDGPDKAALMDKLEALKADYAQAGVLEGQVKQAKARVRSML